MNTDPAIKEYRWKFASLLEELGVTEPKYPLAKFDFSSREKFHEWIDRALDWARGLRAEDGPPTEKQVWVTNFLNRRSMMEKIPEAAWSYHVKKEAIREAVTMDDNHSIYRQLYAAMYKQEPSQFIQEYTDKLADGLTEFKRKEALPDEERRTEVAQSDCTSFTLEEIENGVELLDNVELECKVEFSKALELGLGVDGKLLLKIKKLGLLPKGYGYTNKTKKLTYVRPNPVTVELVPPPIDRDRDYPTLAGTIKHLNTIRSAPHGAWIKKPT